MPSFIPKMLHPFVFSTVFVSVYFAGDRLGSHALERAVGRSEFRFSRMYRGDASADVLILGDSRGVHSFYAPTLSKSLGRRVVNLSYNGLSTEIIECVFGDYLEHNPPPKLLVLEVTNAFTKPSALVNFKPYIGRSPRLSSLLRRENPYEYWATTVSHLYRYNCELFLRVLAYQRKSDQGWILNSRISKDLFDQSLESEDVERPIGADYVRSNLAALGRILEASSAAKVEVRLVVAPYLPQFRKHIKNWDQVVKTFESLAKTEGAAPPRATFWDFSTVLDRADEFSDRIHLNRTGADALSEVLEKEGFFKPGRIPARPAGRG